MELESRVLLLPAAHLNLSWTGLHHCSVQPSTDCLCPSLNTSCPQAMVMLSIHRVNVGGKCVMRPNHLP